MWTRATVVVVLWAWSGCGFSSPATPAPDNPREVPDAGVPDMAAPTGGEPEPPRPPPPSDRDGDGIEDDDDNCVAAGNPQQFDEDDDGVGDACDVCPHVVDPDQADQDRDRVGDRCDPRPTQGGNRILLFLGFNNPNEIVGWLVAGTGARFVIRDGELIQDGNSDLAFLWKNGLGAQDAWITTQVHYRQLDATYRWRGAAVATRWTRTSDFGNGGGCGEMADQNEQSGRPFYNLVRIESGGFSHQPNTFGSPLAINHTATYTVRGTPRRDDVECSVASASGQRTYNGGIGRHDGSGINLAVWGAQVSFKYLIVIE